MINSRIGPRMSSMVPSIPFLDCRGVCIAPLVISGIFVVFRHVTVLFGHFLLWKT